MLLALSGFTVRSNLISFFRASQKSISVRSRKESLSHAGVPEEDAGLEMMHMWFSGNVPRDVRRPTSSQQQRDKNLDEAAKEAEMAKWKAVELFKVKCSLLV